MERKNKIKKENFNKIQIVQRANNGHIDIYVLEESYIYAPVYVYVYMSMSVYACVYLVARQVLARDNIGGKLPPPQKSTTTTSCTTNNDFCAQQEGVF